MTNKKRTKNQHYVPRLHLKHFVGESPRGMIWTYDMRREKTRPSKIDSTGAQNNYYSVQKDDGTYIDLIDDWLTDVEGKAVAGYELLLSGKIPTEQARMDFSTFVASQYARSPANFRTYAEMMGQFVQLLAQMRMGTREQFDRFLDEYERETGAITVSRDELFEFQNDPSRYKILVDRKQALTAMQISDRLQMIFFERRWYVVIAETDFFITCDSPIYREAENDGGPFGDGGFMNPKAHITFPLSPTHLLLITGQQNLVSGDVALVPRSTVWDMNAARAIGAENFLYSHLRDERVSGLAKKFKDARRGMRLSGGPYAEVKVVDRLKGD